MATIITIMAIHIQQNLNRSSDLVLAAESYYLNHPLAGRFHRISLIGKLGNAENRASILLDPNSCMINQFGDPENCTKITIVSEDIVITKLNIPDPDNRNRILYSIGGSNFIGECVLVVSQDNNPLMLIVNLSNGRTVIPLQKIRIE